MTSNVFSINLGDVLRPPAIDLALVEALRGAPSVVYPEAA